MKKTLLVGLAIGLVSLVSTSAFAASTPRDIPAQGGFSNQKNFGGKGIVGSSHDLSNVGSTGVNIGSGKAATYVATVDAQSRICVYCHHPHNSIPTGTIGGYSPLWNRTMSTVNFAAYDNGGFVGTNATDKDHALNAGSNELSGVSLLCMSCHDGVVAMNAYSQNSGSSDNAGGNDTDGAITGSAAFNGVAMGDGKSDMSNHHPMGFNYITVAGIDDEIADPDTVMVPTGLVAGGLASGSVGAGVAIRDLLDDSNSTDNMECVTCHDVHNTKNAPNAERFLWRSNNQSNFCLTCHLK